MNRRYAVVAVSALVLGLVPAVIAPTAFAATPAATTPTIAARLSPVTGLTARPTGSGEHLSWTNPTGSGYSSVVVRRMPGDIAPSSPTIGSAVGRVAAGTSTLDDPSVQPRSVYSYAAFAIYPTGHSAAATARAAFAGATGAQSDAFGGGSITGKVTDAAGHPLRGVEVTAVPASPVFSVQDGGSFFFSVEEQPYSARTAADGTYTIGKITNASYQVCFNASAQNVTGGDSDQLGYDDQCLDDDVAGVGGAVTTAPTASLTANTGGAVSGLVLDATNGAPIQGVEVVVENSDSPLPVFTQTDAHGAFRFGLPAGTYDLCVDATFAGPVGNGDGYVSQCGKTPLTVQITGGVVTSTRIHLAAGGAITGTVRAADGGGPLAGVEVDASSRNGAFASAITAADGTYTLVGLPSATLQVCAYPPIFLAGSTDLGFTQNCITATAVRGATTPADDLLLSAAGGISGRLTTSDGAGIGGVDVEVTGRRTALPAVTQADGSYSVGSLPPGNYGVCFFAPSYPSQCYGQTTPDGQPKPVKVVAGAFKTGVNATLDGAAPGSITTEVSDSAGNLLVGADVVAAQPCAEKTDNCGPVSLLARGNNAVASELTGAGGSAVLTGLQPGKYAVCVFGRDATRGASSTRYQDACSGSTFTITVKSGATTYAKVKLLDGGALTGKVTDAAGHGLAGVGVLPSTGDVEDVNGGPDYGDPAAILTAADGTYRIAGLPAGTTTVCFDASALTGPSPTGYFNECYLNTTKTPTPITISTGTVTTGIDVQLPAGGAISGTVTDSSGTPVAGEDVEIGGRTSGADVQTDANGTYLVLGLAPGRYGVCFFSEDLQDPPPTGYVDQCYGQSDTEPSVPVKVTSAHVTSGIDAVLQPGGAIAGTVTAAGQPITEGFVAYQGKLADGSFYGGGNSIQDGTYDLIGLPAGSYKICFADTDPGVTAQCYDNVAWNGKRIPAGATKVPVQVGQTTTIDVDLPVTS